MGFFHHPEPLSRFYLLGTEDLAYPVGQYLRPAARYRVEPRILQYLDGLADGQVVLFYEITDLRRRKPMHVDLKARLDRLQKSGIIIEPKIGMQSALYKYLRSLKSDR